MSFSKNTVNDTNRFWHVARTCFVLSLMLLGTLQPVSAQPDEFFETEDINEGYEYILQMNAATSIEEMVMLADSLVIKCENYDMNTRSWLYVMVSGWCVWLNDCESWIERVESIDESQVYPTIARLKVVSLSELHFQLQNYKECAKKLDHYIASFPEEDHGCDEQLRLAIIAFGLDVLDPTYEGRPPFLSSIDERIQTDCKDYEGSPLHNSYLLEKANFLFMNQQYAAAADFMQRGFPYIENMASSSHYYAFVRIYTESLRQVGMSEEAIKTTSSIDWTLPLLNANDSANFGLALNNYSLIRLEAHGLEEAAALSMHAYEILEGVDKNYMALPTILSNIGYYHNQLWDADTGIEYLNKAVEMFGDYMELYPVEFHADFKKNLVYAHINLATALIQFKDDLESAQVSIDALENLEEFFDDNSNANVELINSLLLARKGMYAEALVSAMTAKEQFDRLDNAGLSAIPAREQLGLIYVLTKNFEKGIKEYDGLIEFYTERGDWDAVISTTLLKASAYYQMDLVENQLETLELAEKIITEKRDASFRVSKLIEIQLHGQKADAYVSQGLWTEALDESSKTIELARAENRPEASILAFQSKHGVILMMTGQLEEGKNLLLEIMDKTVKDELLWMDVAIALSIAYYDLDEDAEALKLAKRVFNKMEGTAWENTSMWRLLVDNISHFHAANDEFSQSMKMFQLSRDYDREYFEEQALSSRKYLDERFLNENYDGYLYYAWMKSGFENKEWMLDYRIWAKGFIERTTSENWRRANLIARATMKAQDIRTKIRRGTGDTEQLEKELSVVEALMNKLLNPKATEQKLEDITSNLQVNECIVDLIHYTSKNDNGFFAVIYKPNGDIVTMPIITNMKPEFEGELTAFMFPEDKKIDTKFAAKLYKDLWKPMEEELAGYTSIYWSTSGILVNLNPSILYDKSRDEFLMDRYEFSLCADIGDLSSEATDVLSSEEAILVGNPKFGGEINNSQIGLDFLMRAGEMGSWIDLPGTGKELSLVDSLLNTVGTATQTITQTMATEDAFLSMVSPKYLHIATHGFFMEEESDPYNACGLVMNGANESQKSYASVAADNYVTAGEIMSMDLSSTSLVVLSACESAQGSAAQSENYNLVRAFKIAGAKNVIASGWSVSDQKTVYFMEQFYEQLGKGLDSKRAFLTAQRRMRDAYSEPYVWGVFKFFE